MSVISRHLTLLFLKHLGICLAGFASLYLVVDFIEKISEFVTREIPLGVVATYFAAQVPGVVVLLVPVAALASCLITLVLLARNSEIIAFKSSGVSLVRLARPLLAAGLVLSAAMLLAGNLVTPATSRVANGIWDGQVRQNRAGAAAEVVENVWIRDVRLFERMDSYDEARSLGLGLTVLILDENLDLSRRIEADRGFFSPGGLRLFGVREKAYRYRGGGGPPSFTYRQIDELLLPGHPMPPPGLGRGANQRSDELGVGDLAASIEGLKAEGFNPVRQVVDFHLKFASPLLTLIMVVVGVPIGFWRERGGNVAVGLVSGLALSFVYLVTQELSRSMGYAGLLPPLVAAWLPNVFFGLVGLYLFSHLRQ
jgi:lipopolysaccharide export system permease protein